MWNCMDVIKDESCNKNFSDWLMSKMYSQLNERISFTKTSNWKRIAGTSIITILYMHEVKKKSINESTNESLHTYNALPKLRENTTLQKAYPTF